jgi:hypothetical protein
MRGVGWPADFRRERWLSPKAPSTNIQAAEKTPSSKHQWARGRRVWSQDVGTLELLSFIDRDGNSVLIDQPVDSQPNMKSKTARKT